jgi:lysozyme family protein
VGETADAVILLGGNQRDSVRVDAFPRSRLLSLRWPSNATIPVIPEAEERLPSRAAPIGDPTEDHALFERALAHVLKMEGGWADDPYDPGGPTNFGITLATYARDKGLQLAGDNFAQLKAELRAISRATVCRIYRERYWLPASCPELPAALALFHFDAAVNQGVGAAARMLQQAVGAAVDGEIGPETLARAAGRPAAATIERYADIRRRHYRSLPIFWRFGKGWLARVERTLAAAKAVAGSSIAISSPQQQEKDAMTNTIEPTTEAPPSTTKWWGHSMTIWGAAITTLSTVLPTVGPLFGLDITPDVVRQLGDQVVQAAQALGGLAGTILTIYGRVRATTSLERRHVRLTL